MAVKNSRTNVAPPSQERVSEFWVLVRALVIELYNANERVVEDARESAAEGSVDMQNEFYRRDPIDVARDLLCLPQEKLTVWEIIAYENIMRRLGWNTQKILPHSTECSKEKTPAIISGVSELSPATIEKYWALVRLAATEVFGLTANSTEYRVNRLRKAELRRAQVIAYHECPLYVAAALVGLERPVSHNEHSVYLELEDQMGFVMLTDRPIE